MSGSRKRKGRMLCRSLSKDPSLPSGLFTAHKTGLAMKRFANYYVSYTENSSALLLLLLGSIKGVNPPSNFVKGL